MIFILKVVEEQIAIRETFNLDIIAEYRGRGRVKLEYLFIDGVKY